MPLLLPLISCQALELEYKIFQVPQNLKSNLVEHDIYKALLSPRHLRVGESSYKRNPWVSYNLVRYTDRLARHLLVHCAFMKG